MSTPTTSRRSPGPVVPGRRYRAQREVVDVSRPGKRIQCLGIGAALVPLAAVGILLLSDHLSVANATATSMESDKSAVLAHTQVTVAGNSSINSSISSKEVATQHAGSIPVPEQLSGSSPDAELITSYKNQIRELRSENDALLDNLESSVTETDNRQWKRLAPSEKKHYT